MTNYSIALQSRPPELPTYEELMSGRNQRISQRNAMAIQEQQMQQNIRARERQDLEYQREQANRTAGQEATKLAYAGNEASARQQFGAGAGNLEIDKMILGFSTEQRAAVKARYAAAVPVVIQALDTPSREARVALIQQSAGYLAKFGWSAEELTNFDPTDENLKRVIDNARDVGEAIKIYDEGNKPFTLSQGQVRFEGKKEIARGEDKPEPIRYLQQPDGTFLPVPNTMSQRGGGVGGGGGGMGNGVGGGGGGDDVFPRMVGVESRGNQFGRDGKPLTSRAGAIGVAQVMPGTAPEAAKLAGVPFDDNLYRTDRAYNYALGEAYYNEQLRVFGNKRLAAAAYNAGPGAVRRALQRGGPNGWINHVPRETQKYVRDVFSSNAASGGGGGGGGGGGVQMGVPVGKPKPTDAAPATTQARAVALQNLYDATEAAHKAGHLVADDQSYIANRMQEALQGKTGTRTYLPGGTARKTSMGKIDSAANQLLRMFIQKGTSGTLNTKPEQEIFLRSVGAGDATYEARITAIRNFAKQNGIPLKGSAPSRKREAVDNNNPLLRD